MDKEERTHETGSAWETNRRDAATAPAFARMPRAYRNEAIALLALMEDQDKDRREGLSKWLPEVLALLPAEAARAATQQAVRIAKHSGSCAYDFLSRVVYHWETLKEEKLIQWVDRGLTLLERNPSAGRAYFHFHSRTSREPLHPDDQSVRFHEVQDSLRFFIHAVCGKPLEVHCVEQGGQGFSSSGQPVFPFTDGQGVCLPASVRAFPTYHENRIFYRLLAAHQAGHFEFGTFEFSLHAFFRALKQRNLLGHWKPAFHETVPTGEFLSNLQVFHRLFPIPALSERILQLVEGGRVRAHLFHQYPGLRHDATPLIAHILSDRPRMEHLSVAGAFFEMLLRLTVAPERTLASVPSRLRLLHGFLVPRLEEVCRFGARVEDSACMTAEIYLALMPTLERREPIDNPHATSGTGAGRDDIFNDADKEDFLRDVESMLGPHLDPTRGEPNGVMDRSSMDHPNRFSMELQGNTDLGDVQKSLEMAELLQDVSSGDRAAPLRMISLDTLKQLLERGEAIHLLDTMGSGNAPPGLFFKEPVKQLHFLPLVKKSGDTGTLSGAHMMSRLRREQKNRNRNPNAEVFYYDEWDHVIQDYRTDWCRLLETEVKRINDSDFAERVMESYGSLIPSVRRQFEKLRPEQFRRERPLQDGEEVDLDRTVESIVDQRCGLSGSGRLYQHRRKVERDVCTLFLLDMSASTGEPVPSDPMLTEDGDLPPPIETGSADGPLPESLGGLSHLISHLSLGTDLSSRVWPSEDNKQKRIIDVEKEALVVMAEALEALGDRYGIFGFSGCGRSQVEFYTIKEFRQRYGGNVRDRIGAIEPRGSTRMGAALRHCRIKLKGEEARRKNLFLLSDGFPQDQDYGYDRSGHEYGMQDTARALEELADEGTNIYCITVDRRGEDYLRKLCPASRYMVIRDIPSLPEILLKLYRRVTFETQDAP